MGLDATEAARNFDETGPLCTLLGAPMTTAGREASLRREVAHGDKHGLILLDQLRAVGKTRLVMNPGTLPATLTTFQENLRRRVPARHPQNSSLAAATPLSGRWREPLPGNITRNT